MRERSRERSQDLAADWITAACGSFAFVAINVAWVAVWMALNAPGMPTRFNPYPYSFLPVVVALETLALAMLVLIHVPLAVP